MSPTTSSRIRRWSSGCPQAWGDNFAGQCNVPAPPPGLAYVEIAAGWLHTVARLSDGTVVAWGNGGNQVHTPPPGLTYVEIAAGALGSLVYTPAENASGAGYASFDFTVNDGEADALLPSTITFNVNAVNDALAPLGAEVM